MSLVTPREPAAGRRFARERFAVTQQAQRATRWSHLLIAAASSRGGRHKVNEDSHSRLAGNAPVFVVADGVGGGAMAAWASRHLVTRLHESLEGRSLDVESLRDALLEADRDVGRGIARRTSRSGAATVALCAGTGKLLSQWLVGWVGDCRVYRLGTAPGAPPQLLTRDDTYRNLGETPPPGGSPDDPARMIGNGAVTAPNVEVIDLDWGETLLLCSDGVHKHVDPDEMGRVLHAQVPLARRCLRLLEVARLHGSLDDATVLVVQRGATPRARLWRCGCAGALVALLCVALFALGPQTHAWRPTQAPPSPSPSHSQPESRT